MRSTKELERLRAALILGIENNNTRIAELGMEIKRLEDGIDSAQEGIEIITEELRLRHLVAFCNMPNLFASIV
jgi:uncharacterized protein (DUF1786 family)